MGLPTNADTSTMHIGESIQCSFFESLGGSMLAGFAAWLASVLLVCAIDTLLGVNCRFKRSMQHA